MKYIIVLLVVFSVNAQAQSKRLIEVAREFTTKDIILSDGLVYKWKIGATNDTARYFNAGGDEYEVIATFKKVGGPVDPDPVLVTTNIDNNEGTYSGTWAQATKAGSHNNTISWSCTPGATLTYEFDGSEISWITESLNTHGRIAVSIDGGPEETVDLYSASLIQKERVFQKTGLSNGPHTIKLRVTGEKNPASTNVCLVHDYFEVKKAQ